MAKRSPRAFMPRVVIRTDDDRGNALTLTPQAARALHDLTATGYYGFTKAQTIEMLLLRVIRDEIATGILDVVDRG